MDFAKLLRDAFRETIGFVGACAFYLVAPLRWPSRWAERVSDPGTPSGQGYVETRLFFFLSVAAWIVFIHVFLPPPGATSGGPSSTAIDAQRQQVLDTFVQAFAGGVRGAAATGLALGGVLATAVLDAWLRLRKSDRTDALPVDLVVVALGIMNVYVFAIARVIAYLGKDSVAGLLSSIARAAVDTDWPWPIDMALSAGAGGVTRNLVLVVVLAALLALHVVMAWVLWSPLRRLPTAGSAAKTSDDTAAPAHPRGGPIALAFAGFATVCIGLLAAEAIREGQPRLGEAALVVDEPSGQPRGCLLVLTLVNDGERAMLVSRGQYVDLRMRIGLPGRPGQWSGPVDFEAAIAKLNGKAEDAVLVRAGETLLLATMPLRATRPIRHSTDGAALRAQQLRLPVTYEVWLGGGSRILRLAPTTRRLEEAARCLPELLPAAN